MTKFILGTLFGGFVGAMWMALCNIVDAADELADGMEEEAEESEEPEEPEEEDNG